MATLKEIAYDLINTVRPSYSDDDDLDIRQVYYWIKNQRNIWIYNRSLEHKPISEKCIQEYASLVLSTDGTEKKSTVIATPIIWRGQPLLTYVGPTGRVNKRWTFLPYESAKYTGNGRFNATMITAYYLNNYIYVRGYSGSTATVRGIFEDPMDVTGFTVDTEYPMDEYMLEYMKGKILEADMSIFIKSKNDDTNNERNDVN